MRELLHDDETGMKLEEAFWRSTGKNPFAIAAVLYAKFGTVKDGEPPRAKKRRAKPKRTKVPGRKIPSRPMTGGRKFQKRKP